MAQQFPLLVFCNEIAVKPAGEGADGEYAKVCPFIEQRKHSRCNSSGSDNYQVSHMSFAPGSIIYQGGTGTAWAGESVRLHITSISAQGVVTITHQGTIVLNLSSEFWQAQSAVSGIFVDIGETIAVTGDCTIYGITQGQG